MKLFSYILSPIFIVVVFIVFIVFHPLQWVAHRLIGYNLHKNVVDVMNLFLNKSLLILGVRVKFQNKYPLPKNSSLIIVSNHQGMFDIPPISWYFRSQHPKFVSKKELGSRIPSVSFNLRHGGSVLIDRKDGKGSIKLLADFGKKINEEKWAAVIFPEGTRSRNGVPKPFMFNGVKMLAKYNIESYIVPVTINNSWKLFKYGRFPLGIGSPIVLTVHEPQKVNSKPIEELLIEIENIIKNKVEI